MKLNGNEVTIKPVLAGDFVELRNLYDAYLTGTIQDSAQELNEKLKALLSFALKRTDPSLAADPAPLISTDSPAALDSDEIDEIVFAAAGGRGKVLEALKNEMAAWIRLNIKASGLDS